MMTTIAFYRLFFSLFLFYSWEGGCASASWLFWASCSSFFHPFWSFLFFLKNALNQSGLKRRKCWTFADCFFFSLFDYNKRGQGFVVSKQTKHNNNNNNKRRIVKPQERLLLLMVISLDDVGQWRNPIHIRLSTLLFFFFSPALSFCNYSAHRKFINIKA